MTVELDKTPKVCSCSYRRVFSQGEDRPRLDAQKGKELIWDTISWWENFIEGLEKKGRKAIEKTTGLALQPSDDIMVRCFVCARETRLSPKRSIFPVVTWYKVTSYSMEPVGSYAFCGRKAEGVGFSERGRIMMEGKEINRLSGGLTVEDMAQKIIGLRRGLPDYAPEEYIEVGALRNLFLDASSLSQNAISPAILRGIQDRADLTRAFIKLVKRE